MWIINDKFTLLYRDTRDGFGSNDFHSKCDGHANTLRILKVKYNVFGGFTSVHWQPGPSPSKWKSDPNAFIFSLTNKENKPLKIKIDPSQNQKEIYCDSDYGPIFGNGYDICIGNNANTTSNSYSYFSCSFKHPQYTKGKANEFLAGSFKFQLDEIEDFVKGKR